jgi:heptosyltransferase-2
MCRFSTSTPRTILVRAPNWLGDQILAYPFFYHLRHGYPEAQITVACVPWVASLQFRHLVDAVCLLPQSQTIWAKAWALEAHSAMLRAQGPWDLGLCLPHSFGSAWLLARARVRWRRGYRTEARGWLLHESLDWQPWRLQHRAEAYVQVLPDAVRPSHVRQAYSAPFDAAAAWPIDPPLLPPSEPYWILAPGSMATSRRWPLEHFAALAQRIAANTALTGLVVGGNAEASMAQHLCANSTLRLRDYTARGAVSQYASLFQQAHFTVSNDSGLAHVAALCGSPVYIVWGAGDPTITAPLGPGPVHVLHHQVDCWPCVRNVCQQPPARQRACLRGLDPETVWKALRL